MTTSKELFVSNREAVREAFEKSKKDVLEDIEIIRAWIKTQPHLPEMPNDNMIEIFLMANKFNIESTKEKLDTYYTIRSLIPEIYEHSNPLLPPMADISDKMSICVTLPRQTKELYRVYIIKIVGSADDFDAYNLYAQLFNHMELKIQHDASVGDVLVVDHSNLTMGHVLKITPVHVKKAATILEKVFSNSIKGIHIINWPSFVDIPLNMEKTIFKPNMFSRIKLHDSLEELYECVPREILPKDYGGDERPLNELNELNKEMFRANAERFDKLDKMRVKEDLRPTPLEIDKILGYHGNFKKLDVD